MKQKDIAILALVIVVSGIFSFVISKYIFDKPASREQQVETVGTITSSFTQPSSVYFNSSSIDPTQNISVSLNPTPNPTSTFNSPTTTNTGQ